MIVRKCKRIFNVIDVAFNNKFLCNRITNGFRDSDR